MSREIEATIGLVVAGAIIYICSILYEHLPLQENQSTQTSRYAFAGHPIQCNEDGKASYVGPVYNPIVEADDEAMLCYAKEDGTIDYYHLDKRVKRLFTLEKIE